MQFSQSIAFVTGANRGLGLALVEQLLERGCGRVYAAARDVASLARFARQPRVVPIALDVTNSQSIHAAVRATEGVNLLVNNAGTLASFSALKSEEAAIERDLMVNTMGPLRVTRAFAPVLERNRPAAVVNVLSAVSLASMPALGGYSASKAAAFSITQALRADLQPAGIQVHGVFPGPIDTDMTKGFEMVKTSAQDVAAAILDGVGSGELEIFPDAASRKMAKVWLQDPRELAHQFAAGLLP